MALFVPSVLQTSKEAEMQQAQEPYVEDSREPLVPIGFGTRYPEIGTDAIYFGERKSSPYKPGELGGALLTHFVRQDVAARLAMAAGRLPRGVIFLVWDAYRQKETQAGIYAQRHERTKSGHPDCLVCAVGRGISFRRLFHLQSVCGFYRPAGKI